MKFENKNQIIQAIGVVTLSTGMGMQLGPPAALMTFGGLCLALGSVALFGGWLRSIHEGEDYDD